MSLTSVSSSAAAGLTARGLSRAGEIAWRGLDIVLALALIVALGPMLLLIMLAIRLETPGNPIFRQRRLGQGLEPFTINKFRTMYAGVDHEEHRTFVHSLIRGHAEPQQTEREADGAIFKLTRDPRVTRVGAMLRRSSLDELPQLFNVLLGNMSLVGPRPALDYEVDRYPPEAFGRFEVKPGVTGLWQVSGRCQLTFDEMIRLDVDYAARRSLLLNLKILARTVPTVLLRKGAA